MRTQLIPEIDSIETLAKFWDTHDLTDFEDQLEEVTEPIFIRGRSATVAVKLKPREVQTIRQIAKSEGVEEAVLLRQWIVDRLRGSSSPGRSPKRAKRSGRSDRSSSTRTQ